MISLIVFIDEVVPIGKSNLVQNEVNRMSQMKMRLQEILRFFCEETNTFIIRFDRLNSSGGI
jgi:hypothetical protein